MMYPYVCVNRMRSREADIAKAAPFARPVLIHIRELAHEACPDIEEAIKSSMLPDPEGILEKRGAASAMADGKLRNWK